jgi:hypothetical protein
MCQCTQEVGVTRASPSSTKLLRILKMSQRSGAGPVLNQALAMASQRETTSDARAGA